MHSPYKIHTDPNSGYTFITDNNIKYFITFFDRSNELEGIENVQIFEFSFFPENHNHGTHDPRVSQTIMEAINQFFQKESNVLLFICDSIDNKSLARKRLFNKWFISESIPQIEKIDNDIVSGECTYYTSLLLNNNLIEKEKLIKSFSELSIFYNSLKE